MEKSILKTLMYFDIFDYPLKREEILAYLYKNNCNKKEVFNFKFYLDKLIKEGKLVEKEGFYFLKNRENIIELRKQKEVASLNKIRKAQKVTSFLRYIPFIRAVFVTGMIGYLNVNIGGDIDFFIITKKNRIWTARFFATGVFKVLNLRPTEKIKKDRLCFSFYITEDNLNLKKVTNENDIYFYYWILRVWTLYDEADFYNKFVLENKWLKKYLYNFGEDYNTQRYCVSKSLLGIKKVFENILGNWSEKLFKKIQDKIMASVLKEMKNKDNRVVMNDKMLKMHVNDGRQKIYNKWTKKIMDYEI